MVKEVPYYTLDEEGNSQCMPSNGEAYIDDEDLRELLIDFLGDSVSEELKNKTFIYNDKVIFYYHYSLGLFIALIIELLFFLALQF